LRRRRAPERCRAEREIHLDIDPLRRREGASVFRIELRASGELFRPERFDGLLTCGLLLRLGWLLRPREVDHNQRGGEQRGADDAPAGAFPDDVTPSPVIAGLDPAIPIAGHGRAM
jgi:hypothetical protein